eukprot:3692043-Rhodomonas_salina.2
MEALVGRSVGLGTACRRQEPRQFAPVEDPLDQVATRVSGEAEPRVVALAILVRLAAPDADRCCARGVVEEGQKHVAHVDVDQVGRPAGQDSAEGRRERVLKLRKRTQGQQEKPAELLCRDWGELRWGPSRDPGDGANPAFALSCGDGKGSSPKN